MNQVRTKNDLKKVAERELNKQLMKPERGADALPYSDRLKVKLAKKTELSEEEKRTLSIYKEVRTMQVNCIPKTQIAAIIAEKYGYEDERSIYKVIEKTNEFYGEVDDLDKHVATKVLAETYLKIANQFSNNLTWREKDEDTDIEKDVPQWKVKAAMQALEQYQKILGLDNLENLPKPQPLPVVHLTSNPEAINQKPKILYVEDVEEVTDAANQEDWILREQKANQLFRESE